MLGKLKKIKNSEGSGSEASAYHQVLIINSDGEFETLLLTDRELERIRKRVTRNKEDTLFPGFLDEVIATVQSFVYGGS